MCQDAEESAVLYDGASGRPVARVILQRFTVTSFPHEGSRILRTFRLLEDSVRENAPADLLVRAREGWQAVARVVQWPSGNNPGQLQFV